VNTDVCTFDDPTALNPVLTCLDDGAFIATLTVDDGICPPVSDDAPVTVENVAPTCGPIDADPIPPVAVNTPITFASVFSDPGLLDTHTAAWDWGDGTSSAGTVDEEKPPDEDKGTVSDPHSYSAPGEYTVTLIVTDNYPADSEPCTYTVDVPPCIPPVVDAGVYGGDEGSSIPLSDATASDPDGDPLTYSWSIDTDLCTFDDPSLLNPVLTCLDDGAFVATLTVDDGCLAVSDDAPVTVNNVPPTCVEIPPTSIVADVNDLIDFGASFSDPGVWDEHTATWDWGDGTSSVGTVDEEKPSDEGSVEDQHSYSAPGQYTVTLIVTDNHPADSNECRYTVDVIPPTSRCEFSVPVSAAIRWRELEDEEWYEAFYTTQVPVPVLTDLDECCYCLSSQDGVCAETAVDDMLTLLLDGTKILDYDFSGGCVAITPAIVNVPRGLVEEISGQILTVEYKDGCGGYVRADEMWLVGEPVFDFSVLVSDAIPWREAEQDDETFFSKSVRIPYCLPEGGSFCLSSRPDRCEATAVDDGLTVFLDGTQALDHDFSGGCVAITPAIVDVPRETVEQIAGRTVTIEYQDRCGGYVRADEMWLIWVP
jgi:PKD repeat protein